MARKGMDSKKLSKRAKQPGHDRSFKESEVHFIEVARKILDTSKYAVIEDPDELTTLYSSGEEGKRKLGVKPDACIKNRYTKRKFFVEVKKQGEHGNAHERAYKHHTLKFMELLQSKYGYDYHPFVTIVCEDLTIKRRYKLQLTAHIEEENLLFWHNYDEQILREFLLDRCKSWID